MTYIGLVTEMSGRRKPDMETNVEREKPTAKPVELTFGQIEAILSDLHAIAPDKRVAFTARLKALQRNGLPAGERPGRGKAAAFSFLQFMQFAIGIELMQLGVSPSPAAQVVRANWPILRHSIGWAFMFNIEAPQHEGRVPMDLCWLVEMRDFRDISRTRLHDAFSIGGVRPVSSEVLSKLFATASYSLGTGAPLSRLIVHGGALIVMALEEVCRRGYSNASSVVEEIASVKTVIDGLKPGTTPWSAEANYFFDGLLDEGTVENAAESFLLNAPARTINLLRQIAVDGFKPDPNRPTPYRWLNELMEWEMVDNRTTGKEGEIRLTRAGEKAVEYLKEGEGHHVDPQT